MTKAIIFDLDGTLMDTLSDIADSVNYVLEQYGFKTHPTESYKLFTGDGALNLIKRAIGDENSPKLVEVYNAYRARYKEHCKVKTAPYNGVVSALKRLEKLGYKLMVLSNKDDADVAEVVNHYLSDIDFTMIKGRTEGYDVKPSPALGKLMLETCKLKKAKLYYVGDTRTDMKCAKNLKAISIAVLWGFQTKQMLEEETPMFYANTPEEMADIIINN